jgi:hypothetical protein
MELETENNALFYGNVLSETSMISCNKLGLQCVCHIRYALQGDF